ncbi:LamG-like jellyroll fold domain-containing protein [Novosphingobium rosa]|uniref:LamG-like jellyroll fold domain-containing protein n=1 Tax=Novosphingobium rosa TaxID=76978 RepID=UPI000833B728|nr:LamG-like jellyroll fold domain-containing protein [Novosphingobium rosa]
MAHPRWHVAIKLACSRIALASACVAAAVGAPVQAQAPDGLLFRAPLDTGFDAAVSGGDAAPNFRSDVSIVKDGAIGGAGRWSDGGYVAWNAPGNIYAQRGTLSFFWRSHTPVGEAPFVIFRAGAGDHSSWDMAFLRLDWNGHGFDAFVTDANLSRVRVSWTMPTPMSTSLGPDAWHHIAFAWDETQGVRLFWDGKEVAAKKQAADLDMALDQFGLAGRVIAPHQVQSRYNFMRGSDLDDIRVYDHMLSGDQVAQLAAQQQPAGGPAPVAADIRKAWLHRFGWDTQSPAPLESKVTTIRKVEFADAKDLKEWMWKGVDGIAETTWPGVYNRSRLPGRDDYFELPDWNVYVEGGKTYQLTVPRDAAFNRVEIRGAAYGALEWSGDGRSAWKKLATRPQGVVHSLTDTPTTTGGTLRFTNVMQEQPIQEIWAYNIHAGEVPKGTFQLSYTVRADAASDLGALTSLNAHIAGRYPANERATVVALPTSGVKAAVGAGAAGASGKARRNADDLPLVHVLIPSNFGDAPADRPLARAWNYGWENVHDGLDGIALDLPAMDAKPNAQGLIPLDIRVKDPIWPDRDMIDVQVSVRPGEARTLWLDLRDRILTADSLYLTIASAAPDFGPKSIDGMNVRMVFKDRDAAKIEHIADRFNQVKDNWAFLVEEHTASKRARLYQRLYGDITDLLRVDPDNLEARRYWADIGYSEDQLPPFVQPEAPAGMPLWAFRQLEDLKLTRQFVNWWIDNRQVPYGDFGGGISDDTDLVEQWPGLALMGVDPDKINVSLRALSDAVYKNGMIVNGLSYITSDELHVYEEGINSDAERLYLNWGEPKAVERIMATVKALGGLIRVNPAGHMHISSSWYGGRKIYHDEPWAWQKPYGFVIMHSPILLGTFNADPTARGLVTGVIDGLLAHGKQGANGLWSFPNDISFDHDTERAGDGGGASVPMQSAWAAWRFTGDDKYLRPVLARVGKDNFGALAELNENAVTALGKRADWKDAVLKKAKGGDDFSRFEAWNSTGDHAWLEALNAHGIADKSQHMYMYTQGHWWTDRVEAPNELLQRERLGGIGLKRGQSYPGNAVSWRFADPEAAVKVAILVRDATPERFTVVAYNTTPSEQRADMGTWNVTAGQWEMTQGIAPSGGDVAQGDVATRMVELERSGSLPVSFAPGATTVMTFRLRQKADTQPEHRPDLGIGADDVVRKGNQLSVTVHSLGSVAAPAGKVMLETAEGKVLATAAVPALEAPGDLRAKTAKVTLTVPGGAPATLRVRVSTGSPEVTQRNNVVTLGETR